MKFIKTAFFFSFLLYFSFLSSHTFAQQNRFLDGFTAGISANYSTLRYDDEVSALNDILSYDTGFEIHGLVQKNIGNHLKILTGLEFRIFKYKMDAIEVPITNSQGEQTGDQLVTKIKGPLSTFYLQIPLTFHYYPFSQRFLYVTAGPNLSYKVGSSNGTLNTYLVTENNAGEEVRSIEVTTPYEVPKHSNNVVLNMSVGLGSALPFDLVPLKLEAKYIHSASPYRSGENVVSSWSSGFSITILYDFGL